MQNNNTGTFEKKSLSIASARHNHEFKPKAVTCKRYEPAVKASTRATQKIIDLTMNLDDEIQEANNAVKQEFLPGSCKSMYAM